MSIFTKAVNRLGGFGELSARFPGGPEPQGARWERRCGAPAAGTITARQPVRDAAGPFWQAVRRMSL
jgi:hypothetical protein